MWDFEFEPTDNGILGTMPSGEQCIFSTVEQYRKAYEDEENDIVDGLAELYDVIDYPDDYMYA